MPEALAVDWEEIKRAAIAGVPYKELADSWGLQGTDAIRQRASREDWPVPRRVLEKAQKQLADAEALVSKAKQDAQPASYSVSSKSNVTAVTMAAESLVLSHTRTANALVLATEKALSRFAKAPADIETWTDASTAYKLQRLAAGIDREGTQVNVNLAMLEQGSECAWNIRDVSAQSQEQA